MSEISIWVKHEWPSPSFECKHVRECLWGSWIIFLSFLTFFAAMSKQIDIMDFPRFHGTKDNYVYVTPRFT